MIRQCSQLISAAPKSPKNLKKEEKVSAALKKNDSIFQQGCYSHNWGHSDFGSFPLATRCRDSGNATPTKQQILWEAARASRLTFILHKSIKTLVSESK